MFTQQALLEAVLVGVGATLVMDAWVWLCARFGIRMADWRMVGRWIAHLARGRFAHAAIARARPVRHEHVIGWITHYAVGIGYAYALVAVAGAQWIRTPSLLPALAFGAGTVIVPLFVMQPAMGYGFAGSRTASPRATFLRSLANHSVFGAGLFLSAVGLASR